MLCLYCDRPLALLKRLTGDGEFCSKEHRRIYQKEHNQLGLARLLEAHPVNKTKRPAIQQDENRAPAAPPPVEKRAERQPGQAGFISDFLQEASAVSLSDRSTLGPRFQRAAPILAEAKSAQGPEDRSQPPLPKLAAFLAESSALLFAGEVRFPGKPAVEPLAGRPQLGDSHSAVADVTIRLQPLGAGFIFRQLVAPVSSPAFGFAKATRPAGPRFGPLVPAKARSGMSRSGSHPKLPLAAFVSAPAAGGRSIPDRVRSLAAEPRWKPLAAAFPTRPNGKIILVLGTFLRRPVRIANLDSVPDSFEIRLRPISFPRYSPRMGVLEERPRWVDRIGSTSP
jgi:hypothetical protein